MPAANKLTVDLEHVLDHTDNIWPELRGERVFITGGTGFFGRWLLESLIHANRRLNADVHAVVLTRDPEAFTRKAPHLACSDRVQLIAGDVRSFAQPRGTFSHVLHLAHDTHAGINRDQPALTLDTIVEGTRHTLDIAVACKARRFLQTSSGAAYGLQPAELSHTPEDYAGAPNTMSPSSAHSEGKRAAELLGTLYSSSHGIETVAARCYTFVGPHLPLDGHFAIGNFIRDGLSGRSILVNGDGTPYRSYLYAADLAIWLWTLLCRGKSCRMYNVGSDLDVSIAEVAKAVRNGFDGIVDVDIRKRSVPGQLPDRYVPDIQRARTELGLQPWIGLDEAVCRTIAWHRQTQ